MSARSADVPVGKVARLFRQTRAPPQGGAFLLKKWRLLILHKRFQWRKNKTTPKSVGCKPHYKAKEKNPQNCAKKTSDIVYRDRT